MSVRVRLFAGAAESIGRDEVRTNAATMAELIADLSAMGAPDTARVLERCSILIDGRRSNSPDDHVPAGSVVDVLPPFAGG